jgi:choline dehydrogenase-like flavoprotein
MSTENFDVVIVGAGIAGALTAFKLAQAGKRVLILEGGAEIPDDRSSYMERFYLAMAKTPEAPYPITPDNPGPLVLDIGNWKQESVLEEHLKNYQPKGYLIQKGPLPFSSTYERVTGGTTWHWSGTSLRLVPNDFDTQTRYGHGVDWPIGYSDLEPFYSMAEQEIGVAAETTNQNYLGITFGEDPENPGQPYQYPMPEIPPSFVDTQIAKGIGDMAVDDLPVTVTATPQARNSVPFDERRVCAGNTNCIPICPIQAKYDATIHVAKAQQLGAVVQNKSIAYRVNIDAASGLVNGISYKQYNAPGDTNPTEGVATAKLYVLAAHAMETAKLLLISANDQLPNGVANSSDQVGRNLMDHPIQLSYALAKDPVYPFRGPLATSGIESLRDGAFRKNRAPFRVEIGNEGWNWATGDPYNTVNALITPGQNRISGPNHLVNGGLFGANLRSQINSIITRQFRFGALMEQMPLSTNRIVPSKTYTDNLGIPRPEITYDLDDYTKAGFHAARQTFIAIFNKLGATDYTYVNPDDPSAFTFTAAGESEEVPYILNGAGHVMGTYRMGSDPKSSVVDAEQRSHDHKNLFLIGSGVFPSVGTANPTLTIAALCLMAAKAIIGDLNKIPA